MSVDLRLLAFMPAAFALAGPVAASTGQEPPPAQIVSFQGVEDLDDEAGPIDPTERFQAGNLLYQGGDFAGAVAAYAEILDSGLESGDLYYNLGNAYFKLGRLGPSILAYERARRALPRDENVAANLQLARSLTADQITPLPGFWLTRAWSAWVDLLPRQTLNAVVTLGYLLVMSLLVLAVMRGAVRRSWVVRAAGTIAALTAVLAINLAVREFGLGRADYGVILVGETPVQSAPAADPALQLFSIHEGTRVRIDRRSDGWLEVVLEDGKVGWLRSETLEAI
ncbi:MAG: tetratricopeptide repeat protein [Gemmatimonadota bacterium]